MTDTETKAEAKAETKGRKSKADADEPEDGLAPAPEQPEDIQLSPTDAGTQVLPPTTRHADIDHDFGDSPFAAPSRADDDYGKGDSHSRPRADDKDRVVIEGTMVDVLEGAASAQGLALGINGEVFLFDTGMLGTLKSYVDAAVAGAGF